MQLEGKRVLVTGGAGFVGSNLIERLLSAGAIVTCLDNLSTGKKINLLPFESSDSFSFIQSDIRDSQVCMAATENTDLVFHQAALGSVPRSIENPLPTHQTNSSGFVNMLQAATKNGVKRFVYASSSSVYGDEVKLPMVEENIGKHLSPYAVSKYSNELYANVFGKLYGIETIGLRYFNVFGKNQDPNGAYAAVIPKFVSAIIHGGEIEIHGDGMQSRDFTYIDNVLDANICAATTTNEKAFNTIFNVAFGAHMPLIKLVGLIDKKVKEIYPNVSPLKVKNVPQRVGDIKHSFADISKAKNLLGYKPSVTVDEGLNRTIEWYCTMLVNSM